MDFMKEWVTLILKGGVIGIANIIPGVSGGTMAVVMGLYERLIEAIGNILLIKEKRREYFVFLLLVFLGAGISIAIFSWIMDYLLTYYEAYTYLFFIGLIAGSIPSIYRTHHDMKLNAASVITFLVGASLILGMFLSFPENVHMKNTPSVAFNLSKAPVLFISGILSGGSMIMPGVSGSFMLVLLGQYHLVIRAVKNLDILPLIFLGIGIALGIWIFAKIIDIFLKKFPKETMYFILGLLVASLIPIFPGIPSGIFPSLIALLIMLGGGWISWLLGSGKKGNVLKVTKNKL
jgi:putative membrane protein